MNIIFDFDGTIADTTKYFFVMANEVAESFNAPKISEAQFERARNVPPKQVIKELNIPIRALPKLRKASHESFKTRMNQIEPVKNMRPVIRKLSAQHTLGVLTSNDAEVVHDVLKRMQLDGEFAFVNSAISVFGKHRALNKIVKRYKLDKESTVYVGDEVRDIEGARKAGVRCVAVTWGFNTKELLASYEPDLIIESPKKLLNIDSLLEASPPSDTEQDAPPLGRK